VQPSRREQSVPLDPRSRPGTEFIGLSDSAAIAPTAELGPIPAW
jgi:hypothetical protein